MNRSYLRYEQPKKWVEWAKHHAVSVGFIILAAIVVISFLWGKSSIILLDTHGPKTYKAGVTHLSRTEVKPAFKWSNPNIVDIFCIDGVKVVTMNEGLSTTVIGSCE